MAFYFKALLTGQPQDTDTIELRAPGTTTKITGTILAIDGVTPLSNPFTVLEAGGVGNWGFIPPNATAFDVYWVDQTTTLAEYQIETRSGEAVPFLKLNKTSGYVVQQGEIAWNADEETFDGGLNGAVLQFGQELHWHSRCDIVGGTDNGLPVMATGTVGASGRIKFNLMDGTDPANARYILGLTTEAFPAQNDDGKVSDFGKVRGIDTTGAPYGEVWNEGDILWISPTTPGALTNVMPKPPMIGMAVAFVITKSVGAGVVAVRANPIDENAFVPWNLHQEWKDPTGFVDNDDLDVDYDSTTRTVTVSSKTSAEIRYRWQGFEKTLAEAGASWTSSAHDAADGMYFLSSNEGDSFAWSTTVWSFYDVQIAAAFKSTSPAYAFALREVHGMMPYSAHEEFHDLLGTYRQSGLGPTTGTYAEDSATDADTTPGFDSGVIKDEDILTTIAQSAEGTYTTMIIDASGDNQFDTAASFPFRSAGSFILINNPVTGAESPATNNRYVNVYEFLMPVSSDTGSQLYRRVMVQPQAEYLTLDGAQGEQIASLSLGSLGSPEFVFFTRITYLTNNGFANTGKVKIAAGGISFVTGSRASQTTSVGGANPTAENVPFTPFGGVSSTNVQTAIEELDTEKADKLVTLATSTGAHAVAAADVDKYTDIDSTPTISDASVAAITEGQVIQYRNVSGGDLVLATSGSATYASNSDNTTFKDNGSITLIRLPAADSDDFQVIGLTS